MKVNIDTTLIINNKVYQPTKIKKVNRHTHYRYYFEKWTVLITQEDNDSLVSLLMTKNDYTIDKILSDNLTSNYEIAFAIYMDEIEENFNELKESNLEFLIKNIWI